MSQIVGKLAIGHPIAEPVLVDDALNLPLRYEAGPAPHALPPGHALTAKDIEWLKENGVSTVWVVWGPFPETTDAFVLKRRLESGGYVFDNDFYEEMGLQHGFESVEIVVHADSPEGAVQSEMINWDIKAQCAFCYSQNGLVAERRVLDEDGEVTDERFEVECVPSYNDERVASVGICPFRTSSPPDDRACAYKASLVFSLANDRSQRILALETSSQASANYWREGLQAVLDSRGSLRGVPMTLETFSEETIVPGGDRRSVRRTRIVVSDSASVSAETLAVEIPEPTPDEVMNWMAEFNPHLYRKGLAEEGLLPPDKKTRAGLGEYRYRRQGLIAEALSLDEQSFAMIIRARRGINPSNIERWEAIVQDRLSDLTEKEKADNFERNTHASART